MMVHSQSHLDELILNSLYSSNNVEDVLMAIAENMPLHFAVFNSRFEMLYDFFGKTEDGTLADIQHHKQIDPEFLSSQPSLKELLMFSSTIKNNRYFELHGKLTCNVMMSPIINAGYMSHFVLTLCESDDIELTEYAVNRIGEIIKAYSATDASHKITNNYIEQGIISELFSDTIDINNSFYWKEYGGMPTRVFYPPYVMATFSLPPTANSHNTIYSICDELSLMFANSICTVKDSFIQCLFYGLKTNDDSLSELAIQLTPFASKNGLLGGLSFPFKDLSNKNEYIKQSKAVLRCGLINNEQYFIYTAEDTFEESVILAAILSTGKEVLLTSEVKHLLDFDQINGTEYLKTLETFFYNHCQLSATAKALFVDRGTVKYRINKINNLLCCDCTDQITAKRLKYSIAVYNCALKIEQNARN